MVALNGKVVDFFVDFCGVPLLLALAISNMSSAIEILQDRMDELGKIAVENIASTNPIMHRHNSYKDNLLVASNGKW